MTKCRHFALFVLVSYSIAYLGLLLLTHVANQLSEDGIWINQIEVLVCSGLVLGGVVHFGHLRIYQLSVVSHQLHLVLHCTLHHVTMLSTFVI